MKAALKKFLEEEPSVETIYYAVTTMANVGIKSEYTCTCTTVSATVTVSVTVSGICSTGCIISTRSIALRDGVILSKWREL